MIPIWFHWNGARFIIGTLPNAPKVRALGKNPKVALIIDTDTYPPHMLLVRGLARVEVIDDVSELSHEERAALAQVIDAWPALFSQRQAILAHGDFAPVA